MTKHVEDLKEEAQKSLKELQENAAKQITKKGEQSLRRRIRRQIKNATKLRLMRSQLERSQLELIELEPTVVLEPSETTLTLVIHDQVNENANELEPEEVPSCRDSDRVPNGDLASS
ncbi:cysteine-rich perinuclear theca protein 1-like [Mus pahari]|uniref:cysteine-rich perinuclear theca protein 1-like n=1 Tax=Mus pahari TaxID=10093 RepID=UPI001114E293|nr:cysteine-rich perinuclear theca protein 1-like [Mus pahari]